VFLYSVSNRAKAAKHFLPVREGYSPCACRLIGGRLGFV